MSLTNGKEFPRMFHALLMVAVFLGVYLLSLLLPPGPVTYWLSAVAMVIIWITAVARVNDIGPDKVGRRWHVRRYGLVAVGAGVFAAATQYGGAYNPFPTWSEVLFRWGIALTWLTTPDQPPWWDMISGKAKAEREPDR